MLRFVSALLAWVALVAPAEAEAAPVQKVLLVVSGYGEDKGKIKPGYEFDEFAQAYAIFRDNGLMVDVASPKGGKAEADEYDPAKPYNARVLKDPEAVARLADTKATSAVAAKDYAAIFVIGGKGAMFDLPRDPALLALLARNYEANGVIGAVCHGPAVLARVTKRDGTPLIAGKRVTGFTNEEEVLFGEKWAKQFPFMLEDAMRAAGGRFDEADIMLPFVQTDGRIVTGQNPFSTPMAVEAVLRAMGRTPVAREPYSDERSLMLVARFMAGEHSWAKSELSSNTGQYEPDLIAMYGFYRASIPGADAQSLATSLAVMELAAPHFAHPKLALGMAQAEQKLGRTGAARKRVEEVLARKPDMEEAKKLLATMQE
jgi:putative intracellular protease/amidase